MEQLDYYKILGVGKTAEKHDIKDAYRKNALKYHPDKNNDDPAAAEMMKKVNEAYAVLSDDEKRKKYDLMQDQYGERAYSRFRNSYSEHDIFSGSDFNRVFEEFAKDFGFRGFDEIFKDVYGKGFTTFKVKKDGLFGSGFVFFSSGFPGKKKSANSQIPSSNGGSSLLSSVIGKITGLGGDKNGKDFEDTILLKPELARDGGSYAYYLKKTEKKLLIKIPPGVRDGQKIRLAGMGALGKGNGTAGNLFLKVKIRGSLIKSLKKSVMDFKKNIFK